jgi:hypothetical protein
MTTEEREARKTKVQELKENLKKLDDLHRLVAVEFSMLRKDEQWECYDKTFTAKCDKNIKMANETRDQILLMMGYMTFLETAAEV